LLCSTKSNHVVENWAEAFNTIQPHLGRNKLSQPSTCNNFSMGDMITHLSDIKLGNLDRAWTWQTCVEFGFFQGTDPGTSIFFSDIDAIQDILPWCELVFGIKNMIPNTEWTNAYYGGWNLKGSNILFTNGLIDPWSTLSITSNQSGILAVDYYAAHCAPMTQPTNNDPPSLTAARQNVINFIQKLLYNYKKGKGY